MTCSGFHGDNSWRIQESSIGFFDSRTLVLFSVLRSSCRVLVLQLGPGIHLMSCRDFSQEGRNIPKRCRSSGPVFLCTSVRRDLEVIIPDSAPGPGRLVHHLSSEAQSPKWGRNCAIVLFWSIYYFPCIFSCVSLTVNLLISPMRNKNSCPSTQLIIAGQQCLSTLSFLKALAHSSLRQPGFLLFSRHTCFFSPSCFGSCCSLRLRWPLPSSSRALLFLLCASAQKLPSDGGDLWSPSTLHPAHRKDLCVLSSANSQHSGLWGNRI